MFGSRRPAFGPAATLLAEGAGDNAAASANAQTIPGESIDLVYLGLVFTS